MESNRHEAAELRLAAENLSEMSACEEMVVDQVFSTWRSTLAAVEEFLWLSPDVHQKVEEQILACVKVDLKQVYPVLPSRICQLSPIKRTLVTVVVRGTRVDRCPVHVDAPTFTSVGSAFANTTSSIVSPVDVAAHCIAEIEDDSDSDVEGEDFDEQSRKRRKF
jgi:hypothetical protein